MKINQNPRILANIDHIYNTVLIHSFMNSSLSYEDDEIFFGIGNKCCFAFENKRGITKLKNFILR